MIEGFRDPVHRFAAGIGFVAGILLAVRYDRRLRAQGTAFIVVSHYLQMIESLQPDQVLRLDQGRIAETGGLELARSIAETGFTRATA